MTGGRTVVAVRLQQEQVLRGPRVLNLQMFHRKGDGDGGEDGGGVCGTEPRLPVLPDLLDWPCPRLFRIDPQDRGSAGGGGSGGGGSGGSGGGGGFGGGDGGGSTGRVPSPPPAPPPPAVRVDGATRVSKGGALTWWHLDDSGEHVFQVALPLKRVAGSGGSGGAGKGVIVKVFVFAQIDDYDFIFQDDETNATGRVAALDPFRTNSLALPTSLGKERRRREERPLPVLWVAGLEAGGCPLLSPPNMPHMVLTARDCVMVEERRVSTLFLDEVTYFLRRASQWETLPILYPFLREGLCEPATLHSRVVAPLLRAAAFAAGDGGDGGDGDDGDDGDADERAVAAALARQSLAALRSFRWAGAYAAMGLDPALLRPTAADQAALAAFFSAPPPASSRPRLPAPVGVTRRRARHARLSAALSEAAAAAAGGVGGGAVLDLGPSDGSGSGGGGGGGALRYACCVHVDGGRAVWGPPRRSRTECEPDRLVLQFAMERGELDMTLRDLKWRAETETEGQAVHRTTPAAQAARAEPLTAPASGAARRGDARGDGDSQSAPPSPCRPVPLLAAAGPHPASARGARREAEAGTAVTSRATALPGVLPAPPVASAASAAARLMDGLFGEDSQSDSE